jgi:hypothetical protein
MDIFVAVRALHILVAALWVGAGLFLTLFLMPTLRQLGTGGGPVHDGLERRGMGGFMAAIAVLTVLSGVWLYWQMTSGFDRGVIASNRGIMYGLGGLAGLLAAIIGGAFIGRGLKQIRELGRRLAELADDAERDAHLQMLARLRRRTARASQCDSVLLVAALLLMTLGHYA